MFTLCGGHIMDIHDGCVDEGIRIVDVRHEQVAAHAVGGYSRVTGPAGCAVVTAGPGTTDASTGVANAFRAESPMLPIGGRGATDQHRMGSLEDLPQVDLLSPISKFSASVPANTRVADMVSMAFREACLGAAGPSYPEIPRDVLERRIPVEQAVVPEPGRYRASTRRLGDPPDVERPAELLANSSRPCILPGQQVRTCRAGEAAAALLFSHVIPGYPYSTEVPVEVLGAEHRRARATENPPMAPA